MKVYRDASLVQIYGHDGFTAFLLSTSPVLAAGDEVFLGVRAGWGIVRKLACALTRVEVEAAYEYLERLYPKARAGRSDPNIHRALGLHVSGLSAGRLSIAYDTMGEPFREGVNIGIVDGGDEVGGFMAADSVCELRNHLRSLLAR